eukprot:PhM_4_TR1856/c0_g1_i1/m.61547
MLSSDELISWAKKREKVDALVAAISDSESTTLDALNTRDAETGVPLIWFCAQQGLTAAVDALLQRGADTKFIRTREERVPLVYIAAQNGHLDIVQKLVEAGVSSDEPKASGATPLFIAAQTGHLALVQYLVQLRPSVDIEKRNDMGVTPLIIACFGKHMNVAHALLWVGANPFHRVANKNAFEWCLEQGIPRNDVTRLLAIYFLREPVKRCFWLWYRHAQEESLAKMVSDSWDRVAAAHAPSATSKQVELQRTQHLNEDFAATRLGLDDHLISFSLVGDKKSDVANDGPAVRARSLHALELASAANADLAYRGDVEADCGIVFEKQRGCGDDDSVPSPKGSDVASTASFASTSVAVPAPAFGASYAYNARRQYEADCGPTFRPGQRLPPGVVAPSMSGGVASPLHNASPASPKIAQRLSSSYDRTLRNDAAAMNFRGRLGHTPDIDDLVHGRRYVREAAAKAQPAPTAAAAELRARRQLDFTTLDASVGSASTWSPARLSASGGGRSAGKVYSAKAVARQEEAAVDQLCAAQRRAEATLLRKGANRRFPGKYV